MPAKGSKPYIMKILLVGFFFFFFLFRTVKDIVK